MAQLKDDCFAFGDALIPYDEAMRDLLARIESVTGVETVIGYAVAIVIVANPDHPRPDFPHCRVCGLLLLGDDHRIRPVACLVNDPPANPAFVRDIVINIEPVRPQAR